MKFIFSALFCLLICCSICAQEVSKRVAQLKERAEKNDAKACYILAKMARENKLSQDPNVNAAEYQVYLDKAAKLNYPKALYEISVSYLTGSNLMNQQLAYPYLQKLVKLRPSKSFSRHDLLESYYWMGHCLEYGKGARIDAIRANRYYLLATIGSTDARFIVVRQLLKAKDKTPAFDLLYQIYTTDPENSGAKIESVLARTKLRSEMEAYLAKKSDAGDLNATMILAENLMNGGFFAQQRTRAVKYYQKAVEQGSSKAALYMAHLHENELFNLPNDPEIIKKYLRRAFIDPEMRREAAKKLAVLTERQLNALQEKEKTKNQKQVPAGEKQQAAADNKKTASDELTSAKIAAAGSADKSTDEIEQLKEYLFYYLMIAHEYGKARDFVNKDSAMLYHAKDIILKVKEYRAGITAADGKMSPKQQTVYMDRLRMAFNAGYPLAVLEYWDDNAKKARHPDLGMRLQAMLAFPWPEDAKWCLTVSQYYIAGNPKTNSLYSPQKSLEYLKKSAELHGVDALDELIRIYREGDKTLGIKPDASMVKKYTAQIVQDDVLLQKPAYFMEYLHNLKNKPDKSIGDLKPLFRSMGLNPYADFEYALLRFDGDKAYGIEKDVNHAMLLLHLSAHGENADAGIREIIQRFKKGTKPNRTPDEVLLDTEMTECYKALL